MKEEGGDRGAGRCRNGHAVDSEGVCSQEREFRKAAAARGLDVEDVRRLGWSSAERRSRRSVEDYAP